MALGEKIGAAMVNNVHFTPTPPAVTALAGSTAALRAAIADVIETQKQWKLAIAVREQKRLAQEKLLNSVGALVDSTAAGDEAIIIGAGLDVAGTPTPIGVLGAPEHPTATAGDMEGEIDLMWDSVAGAGSYEVECKLNDGTSGWTAVKTVTQSKMAVTALTPGLAYLFRVRAIGAAGPGPWSDLALRRAP